MNRPPIVVHIRSSQPAPREFPRPQASPPPPKDKPNPLAAAQSWLRKRLTERTLPDGSTGLFLDGTPADLTRIMRETNRVLAAHGEDQILANPAWKA